MKNINQVKNVVQNAIQTSYEVKSKLISVTLKNNKQSKCKINKKNTKVQ